MAWRLRIGRSTLHGAVMQAISNLALGFSISLQPINLLFCFIGVLLGVVVGILPGLGSAATIALLLPITYFLDNTTAIIMLAGIWYGSMYGGSITSILLRVPGEAASVMVAIDGYEMTKQGRGGVALGVSILSAFIAGMFGLIGLSFLAPALADFALSFGPPEYFALTLLGLTLVSYLATTSIAKAIAMTILGLLLGTVGLDPVRSSARFTFGSLSLQSGIDLIPMVMGLFGISEVLLLLEEKITQPAPLAIRSGLRAFLPDRNDCKAAARPLAQGTLVGFLVGLLPGGGATVSSYVAYAVAKRWRHPSQKFGEGAVGGVAAPEAAANAATCAGFIPLLTLGLPENAVMALMLGAFLLHGITPGPLLIAQHPEMFWGIVTSMFIGNVILLLTMLPLIGQLAKITTVPNSIVVPIIVIACLAGAYGVNNNATDIATMTIFGVLGYFMRKLDYPPAPMVLAFVIGPIMESSLRQSLIMSGGSFGIFVERGISGSLVVLAACIGFSPLMRRLLSFLRARGDLMIPVRQRLPKLVLAVCAAGLLFAHCEARAADYPTKSITVIVPYPPGGRTDLAARALTQFLKEELKVPVAVVNKPGASGVLGAKEVAAATPNGYTLGIFSTGFLTSLYTVPTPPQLSDYELVSLFNMDPAAIAVNRDKNWKSLQDFVAYGRAHPRALRVGINAGSSAHIFAVAFMDVAGIEAVYVPFRGGGERTPALAGGHIDADFDIVAPMRPLRDAGKISVLGIATDVRAPEYPDIPTMAEGGVPLVISSWQGVFAPRGTPQSVLARLDAAIAAVCAKPEFVSKMNELLLGIRHMNTTQFKAFFDDQSQQTIALTKKLGLYLEKNSN
jgi:putative tricarboxylic transport membrane protein